MTKVFLSKIVHKKALYTPLSLAALVIIAKTWKKPKCPWTYRCISKMWYTHTWLSLKKEGNSDICYNMDVPGGH